MAFMMHLDIPEVAALPRSVLGSHWNVETEGKRGAQDGSELAANVLGPAIAAAAPSLTTPLLPPQGHVWWPVAQHVLHMLRLPDFAGLVACPKVIQSASVPEVFAAGSVDAAIDPKVPTGDEAMPLQHALGILPSTDGATLLRTRYLQLYCFSAAGVEAILAALQLEVGVGADETPQCGFIGVTPVEVCRPSVVSLLQAKSRPRMAPSVAATPVPAPQSLQSLPAPSHTTTDLVPTAATLPPREIASLAAPVDTPEASGESAAAPEAEGGEGAPAESGASKEGGEAEETVVPAPSPSQDAAEETDDELLEGGVDAVPPPPLAPAGGVQPPSRPPSPLPKVGGETPGSPPPILPLHASPSGVQLSDAITGALHAAAEPAAEGDAAARPKSKAGGGFTFADTVQARVLVGKLLAQIAQGAMFSFDYLLLVFAASLLAGVGLVTNNVVVIVASMLVSPLMGPILSITFGAFIQDGGMVLQGLVSEGLGFLVCILAGVLVAAAGAPFAEALDWPTSEMSGRGDPWGLLSGIAIAIPSGVGVGLSVTGANTSSLVGVAISASLLPPLVNAGICWYHAVVGHLYAGDALDTSPSDFAEMGTFSFILTVVNIICIFFFALLIFAIKEAAPIRGKSLLFQTVTRQLRSMPARPSDAMLHNQLLNERQFELGKGSQPVGRMGFASGPDEPPPQGGLAADDAATGGRTIGLDRAIQLFRDLNAGVNVVTVPPPRRRLPTSASFEAETFIARSLSQREAEDDAKPTSALQPSFVHRTIGSGRPGVRSTASTWAPVAPVPRADSAVSTGGVPGPSPPSNPSPAPGSVVVPVAEPSPSAPTPEAALPIVKTTPAEGAATIPAGQGASMAPLVTQGAGAAPAEGAPVPKETPKVRFGAGDLEAWARSAAPSAGTGEGGAPGSDAALAAVARATADAEAETSPPMAASIGSAGSGGSGVHLGPGVPPTRIVRQMSSPGTLAILKGGLAAQASASQSHHRRTASASTASFAEQGAQVQVELQDQGAFAFGSLLGGGTVGAAITRSLAQANAELGHGSQYPRRR